MASLVLGPLLRHVGETDATVWVETDAPATVEVLGTREETWEVSGHHYALVCVEGLAPGSDTPYEVRLDGELVWPASGSPYPPSRIRTLGHSGPLRVIFGSCRYARPEAVADDKHFDADALDAYGVRMMRSSPDQWPDALLLLGDQVYADETSEHTKERIRAKRDIKAAPYDQVADFEEYTWLYRESWTDPAVRWLLSTVATSMIFDDHDVRDDWNTSESWREEVKRTSWWEERIIGGLSSYWVYQHIGNLSPEALGDDELYLKVRADGGDCAPMLREFAAAADREADGQKGARWSYRRDFGRTRVLVIYSRCGRILAEGERSMVSEAEFRWIEAQTEGDYDHLLVGTSLPWLLARALHDIESWNERLADGSRGARMARIAEKFRRMADLEHWAAFRKSFDRLARLFGRIGRGEQGEAPATICVLSGDVHHAYASQARYDDPAMTTRVFQLTCSPVHNYVPLAMKVAFRLAWSRAAEKTTRFLLDRVSHVPRMEIDWDRLDGPFYGNEIATLLIEGRSATLLIEKASARVRDPRLEQVCRRQLA
jgi:phosphodiesterase/alkaline phosphatase D-like protein